MAENVRTEVCDTFGITEAMQDEVLPELHAIAAETGCTLLDYEWNGSCITDDDTQFFDGFHLMKSMACRTGQKNFLRI